MHILLPKPNRVVKPWFLSLFLVIFGCVNIQIFATPLMDSSLIKIHIKKARNFKDSSNYQQAIKHYQKVIDIYSRYLTDPPSIPMWEVFIRNKNELSECYLHLGLFEQVQSQLKWITEVGSLKIGTHNLEIAESYALQALLFTQKRLFKKAEVSLLRAKNIYKIHPKSDHSRLAYLHSNIGVLYGRQHIYENALEHFFQALQMHSHNNCQNLYAISYLYNNIGLIHFYRKQYSGALKFFQKALELSKKFPDPNHPFIGAVYENLGILYQQLNNHHLAKDFFVQALFIKKKNVGENHYSLARTYINIATIYNDNQQFEKALAYNFEALNIYSQHEYTGIEKVVLLYNLGNIFSNLGQYDKALMYYQASIRDNTPTSKGQERREEVHSETHALSKRHLMLTMCKKAQTYFAIYKRSPNKIKYLERAYQTYQSAVSLIENMKASYSRHKDRIVLQEEILDIYREAVKVGYILYSSTKKEHLIQEIFTIFEMSRSANLYQSIHNKNKESNLVFPEAIIHKRDSISRMLSFYEKSIFEASSTRENVDHEQINLWHAQIIALKQQKEILLTELKEKTQPLTKNHFSFSPVNFTRIKKDLIEKDQVFIEYFEGIDAIYVILITTQTSKLLRFPADFSLEKLVSVFRKSLQSSYLLDTSSDKYTANIDTLTNISYILFQKLVEPLYDELSQCPEWIICTSGLLEYVPFEALISSIPSKIGVYKSYPYLIKKHQISYAYSASILLEQKETQYSNPLKSFAGFAPSFTYKNDQLIANNNASSRMNLRPLFYNQEEIKVIQQITGGDIFCNEEANKDNFMSHVSDYQIIHFSTHGKANGRLGDYSFLAMGEAHDQGQELLYNRELYPLKVKADLVVLGACETGIGELQKGEGVVSLARGFTLAGAKSVIMSKWNVDDQSAKEIMVLFYSNIKQGMTKAQALRQAKLEYLTTHTQYEAHPFFWAGFVPIGDMAPIEFSDKSFWIWWVLMGTFVLLMVKGLTYMGLKNYQPKTYSKIAQT